MAVKFHIPDFGHKFPVQKLLLNMMKNFPQYFREGIEIASVYGEFPSSLWNGGRCNGGACDKDTIKMILKSFNEEEKIPLRFTFTNPLIETKDLSDKFCNMVLNLANNGMNEVIVVSPILEQYIRQYYPNYKLTSSTCKQIEGMDALVAELEKDYKYVVLDYNWNNRFEELETLPHKEKCEILVNALCPPHCGRRKAHYEYLGRMQKAYCKFFEANKEKEEFLKKASFECPHMDKTILQIQDYPTHITPDAIWEKYVPMGFENFKIEGRSSNVFNLVETYMYYMVKPEYRDEARLMFLCSLANHDIITVNIV